MSAVRPWTARTLALSLSFLLLPLLGPPAAAQGPLPVPAQNPVYSFALEVPEPQKTVEFGSNVGFPFIFRDLSRDGSPQPGVPTPATSANMHYVTFTVTPLVEDAGWTSFPPTPVASYAGQVTEDLVFVQALPSAVNPFYPVNLTATVEVQGGQRFSYSATLVGYSPGVKAFNVLSPPPITLKPSGIAVLPVQVTNNGLLARGFALEQQSVTCGMNVAAPGHFIVRPKETLVVNISVEAPAKKPYYLGDQCQAQFLVSPEGSRGAGIVVTASVQIDGGYVDPQWVIWAVEILLVLLLIIFFIVRRKQRIEEELLGKPQKPWLIPVEALYLRALRQKDERAWYVVRHHLMEEEYRSALLWYKSYKKATRGNRRKEALVLGQEKKYEHWKAKWAKRIAQPIKEADRFEAKLQRKLDRKARKQDGANAAKVRTITKKMAAAHAKQVERSLERWQKDVKKANKKGLEPPERPVVPEPDYPEEPEPATILLADHKWSKKAARFRARRVKEQGNLEVRFEKADARHLAKLRRKVRRMARKLDDPDFVAEHPLLRAEA